MKWNHVAGTAWNGIVNWVRQESAAATALVQCFIALGIAFAWWHWNNAQTGAVIGIVSALLGMFVRSQVTPVVRTRQPKRVATAVPPAVAPRGDYPGGTPDWPDPPAGPPFGPGARPR